MSNNSRHDNSDSSVTSTPGVDHVGLSHNWAASRVIDVITVVAVVIAVEV